MGAQRLPNRGLWGYKRLKKRPLEKTTENHRQNPKQNIVFWKVGHAIRPRLCSPNTLFTFLCFSPKQSPTDLKKLPKMDTNPSVWPLGTPLGDCWSFLGVPWELLGPSGGILGFCFGGQGAALQHLLGLWVALGGHRGEKARSVGDLGGHRG